MKYLSSWGVSIVGDNVSKERNGAVGGGKFDAMAPGCTVEKSNILLSKKDNDISFHAVCVLEQNLQNDRQEQKPTHSVGERTQRISGCMPLMLTKNFM